MTTDDPTTPPPLPGAGDSRLDSFLQKAAPIIAVERGINARSRVLLESLARDIKLPDDLFDQAIHMLQGAPPVANKTNNRWIEAFCKYLERKIKHVPQGILTSDIEARVISKGVRKFALTEDQARDAVRETATDLGLRRISQSEAERHVEGLIQQKVGDSEWLDDASVKRLRKAGREWGLTPDQVDAIIRKFTHVNRQKQEKEHRTTMVFLTAAGAVIVIMLCVFVGVVLFGTGPKQDPEVAINPDDPDENEKTPKTRPRTVKTVTPPKWWDDGIALAVGRVKGYLASDEARTTLKLDPDDHSLFDRFRDLHAGMASTDETVRGGAYEALVNLCREDLKDLDSQQFSRARLDQIFTACYALDPSDEAADRLRDSFLAMAKVQDDRLPKNITVYKRGLWVVRVAIAALKYDKVPGERADALEIGLGRIVGAAINRRAEQQALFRQCYTGLAKSYFQQLSAEASEQTNSAALLHEGLLMYILSIKHIRDHIARKDWLRFNADVLGAILSNSGSRWKRFEENKLIEICVYSEDPINVLKMVEAMERTDDSSLQSYLVQLLSRREGVVPMSLNVEDVASAVRKTLGVTAATASTGKDRWKMLQARVDKALARRPTSVTDHGQSLKNTVQLAYLATLACAVTQQELGFPIFDQLMTEGSPSLTGKKKTPDSDEPFSDPSRDSEPLVIPNAAQQNRLKRTITKIENSSDFIPAERLSTLRELTHVTRIPEISPNDGAVIAKYVFASKENAEQSKIVEIIQKSDVFARWKYFRLAMADQVAATKFSQSKVESLLSALFKHRVELDAAISWKQSAYDHLLRSVLDDLKDPGVSTSNNDDKIFDMSADALHLLYKSRARLLGLAPAQYESTGSSAQALRLLVDRTASKLGAGSKKTPDGRFLAGLPHELRAVEYLGNNDLKQTVLLQRIWLRLLSIELKRRQPDRGDEAAQLVDKVTRDDAKATDLIVQLVNGEFATLNLWMLHAP